MKRQQKLRSFFYPEAMVVEPENHEDGLDKDGSKAGVRWVTLQNFKSQQWCQLFKVPKSKFDPDHLQNDPCGTYD